MIVSLFSLYEQKNQGSVYNIIKLLAKIIGLIWTLRNDNVRSEFWTLLQNFKLVEILKKFNFKELLIEENDAIHIN